MLQHYRTVRLQKVVTVKRVINTGSGQGLSYWRPTEG